MKRLTLKPLVLKRLGKKPGASTATAEMPSLVEHLLKTFGERLPQPPAPSR